MKRKKVGGKERKKICEKKNEVRGYLRERKRKETLRKWEIERTEKRQKKG